MRYTTPMNNFNQLAKPIKLVIFDVDGVLTDGRVYMSESGHEHKAFHIHDGLGMKMLLQAGIEIAIITSRSSQLVAKRMQELGVKHVYQGQKNKVYAYSELLKKLNLSEQQVAYVGDDLPDLTLIRRSGFGIAVANAVPWVREQADWVTTQQGGQGAVREVCELILQAQGLLKKLQETYL